MDESIILEPLGNIFKTTSGGTPSRKKSEFYNGNIPWVKSGELDNNIIYDTDEKITEYAIKSSSAKIFPAGTLLIALYGATIGKLAILGTKAATNQAICGIFDNGIIHSKYTYYFLLFSRQKFVKSGFGGAQPNISQDIVRKQLFPIIPLPEQRAIVSKIEQLFSDLDNGIENFKKAQEQLKIYRQAVLKNACEGKLVPTEAELACAEGRDYEPADVLLERILGERREKWNGKGKFKEAVAPDTSGLLELPEGWAWATIWQLAASESYAITDGPFGSNLKTSHYTEMGPRVIRLQNIGDGFFKNAYAHISQQHYDSLSKHSVQAGDLVIAALGEHPPRACIIPPSVGLAIVKADCIRFKPDNKLALNSFLNCALNSEPTRTRTACVIHGMGRPRLNLGEIKSILLSFPPLAEQRRIVTEVERRLSICDNMEATIAESLQKAESLRQSILKKAFEGKLLNEKELEEVRNAPDWEPAEKLLERIKAEKTNMKAKKKGKK